MKYIDIKINDNDILLSDGEPILLGDKNSVIQDIKHLIRESGLFVESVGERDTDKRNALRRRLERMIEEDVRLVPGSVSISELDIQTWLVQADSTDFGSIGFEATVLALTPFA